MRELDTIQSDSRKLIKTIESCETAEQLKAAFKAYKLWQKKYNWLIEAGNHAAIYYDGNAIGILTGMSKFLKTTKNK